MSKNNTGQGGDNTGESEGPRLRDSTSASTATDAVISGPDGKKNQESFNAQKSFQNQDSPSEREIKAVQPGETLEQYQIRVKGLEQNRFEITGLNGDSSSQQSVLERYGSKNVIAQSDTTLAAPKPTEPDYIPGYSKQAAEARAKEILKNDKWSSEEMDFLTKFERKKDGKIDGDGNPTKSDQIPKSADPHHPADRLKTGIHTDVSQPVQKKFQLSSEAEEVEWNKWQERLNKEIDRKLTALTTGANLPVGAEVNMVYDIRNDGAFNASFTSNDNNYAELVRRAVNETFKYHPELKKFPEGTARTLHEREVKFRVGGEAGHTTGSVEREIRKE